MNKKKIGPKKMVGLRNVLVETRKKMDVFG